MLSSNVCCEVWTTAQLVVYTHMCVCVSYTGLQVVFSLKQSLSMQRDQRFQISCDIAVLHEIIINCGCSLEIHALQKAPGSSVMSSISYPHPSQPQGTAYLLFTGLDLLMAWIAGNNFNKMSEVLVRSNKVKSTSSMSNIPTDML